MKQIKRWREFNERLLEFRYAEKLADTRWRDFPKKFVVDFGLLGLIYLAFILVMLEPWGESENAGAAAQIFTRVFTAVFIFNLMTLAIAKLNASLKSKRLSGR